MPLSWQVMSGWDCIRVNTEMKPRKAFDGTKVQWSIVREHYVEFQETWCKSEVMARDEVGDDTEAIFRTRMEKFPASVSLTA